MFSQKNPSLAKLIVACLAMLILKVLTIGVEHGAIGRTVSVRFTKPATISAAVGV